MDRDGDSLGCRGVEGVQSISAVDGDGLVDSLGHGLTTLVFPAKQLLRLIEKTVSSGTVALVDYGSLSSG